MKLLTNFFIILVIALLVAACGGGVQPQPVAPSAKETAPAV